MKILDLIKKKSYVNIHSKNKSINEIVKMKKEISFAVALQTAKL